MKDLVRPHYFVADGEFIFTAGGERKRVVRMGREVSMLFSWNDTRAESSTLYKHGKPKDVRKAYRSLREAFGKNHIADHARMITMTLDFPLEELNRFLNISGYIGIFLAHAKALGGIEGKNFFSEHKERANEHA